MDLQTEWELTRLPDEYRRAFMDPQRYLGAGSFGCVAIVDSERVVKVTSCRASMRYLSELAVRTPLEGEPQVFDILGCVGKHKESNAPLMAFVMERLHTEDSLTEIRPGKGPRGGALFSDTVEAASSRIAELRALVDEIYVGKLGSEHDYNVRMLSGSAIDARLGDLVMTALRKTSLSALRPALGRIINRQRSGEWALDLGNHLRQNVLLSVWGEPVFADPVFTPVEDDSVTPLVNVSLEVALGVRGSAESGSSTPMGIRH